MPTFELMHPNGEQIISLAEGKIFLAGRSPDCDIRLDGSSVSRHHAAFARKNGLCAVKDLNSANGTFVNENKIARATLLKNGDRIRISSYTVLFTRREEDAAQTASARGGTEKHTTHMRLPRAMLLDPKGQTILQELLDSAPPYHEPKPRRPGDTTTVLKSNQGSRAVVEASPSMSTGDTVRLPAILPDSGNSTPPAETPENQMP